MTGSNPAGRGAKRRFGEVPAPVLAAELDLAGAWERVREKAGMPGADGIPVSRFARAHKALLRALQSRLASDSYRALPLRLAEIPKKSGVPRLLLVPAVVDRVAQSATATWLSDRWNAEFDSSSFAYRPGLGVADALRALAALRDRGYRWVLDADIRNFLDTASQCTPVHEVCSKSPGWASTTLIRKPLRLPRPTWMASSSPRFTRCNTVWRETPSLRVASSMGR
jgi:hypothetical protein